MSQMLSTIPRLDWRQIIQNWTNFFLKIFSSDSAYLVNQMLTTCASDAAKVSIHIIRHKREDVTNVLKTGYVMAAIISG
jgi:hypothetical protein